MAGRDEVSGPALNNSGSVSHFLLSDQEVATEVQSDPRDCSMTTGEGGGGEGEGGGRGAGEGRW